MSVLQQSSFLAKRMECVELAPAFVPPMCDDSASKLDALHALRAIRSRLRPRYAPVIAIAI